MELFCLIKRNLVIGTIDIVVLHGQIAGRTQPVMTFIILPDMHDDTIH